MPALLARACVEDCKCYHAKGEFLAREQLPAVFESMGAAIPDLAWEVVDMQVVDDRVIVRGRATGTAAAESMGIDVFTVHDGKLASRCHIENRMTALDQLKR
ncbi:ester cyclase [Streptomyces sp. NPDC059918]|uniref:ester cyclase n=1 Tax=unclassified Streptomyces TaxID=2593676 RepID=UPI0036524E12